MHDIRDFRKGGMRKVNLHPNYIRTTLSVRERQTVPTSAPILPMKAYSPSDLPSHPIPFVSAFRCFVHHKATARRRQWGIIFSIKFRTIENWIFRKRNKLIHNWIWNFHCGASKSGAIFLFLSKFDLRWKPIPALEVPTLSLKLLTSRGDPAPFELDVHWREEPHRAVKEEKWNAISYARGFEK